MRKLVREHAFELCGRSHRDERVAEGDRGASRPAAGRERARMPVPDEIEPGLRDPGPSSQALDTLVERGHLAGQELLRADHAERDPVGVDVDGSRQQKRAENQHREPAIAPEPVADCGKSAAESDQQEPAFQHVPDPQERAHDLSLVVVAIDLVQAARRPVRLGRVAAAGAVERGDVLQRDQDVTVQLDVGDVLDEAVSGEHAVLVVASEQGDLDLLALVLVRVVLHPAAV